MNYRPYLDKDLQKFSEVLPEYTLCQQIFAIMQVAFPNGWSKEDLLSVSDEELYINCLTTIKKEKDE